MVSFRNKPNFFATEATIYLKGVLITFHFVSFLTRIIILIWIYSWSVCILFLNEDVPVKKAKITAEGDFSQPSSKRHSFAEVFLVSLIINLIWGERQDFEINKPAKGWKKVSRQNGHLINLCIPKRLSSILELYYWEELSIYRITV